MTVIRGSFLCGAVSIKYLIRCDLENVVNTVRVNLKYC